nr:zinc-ribbon domain-containing protein [Desulfobacterales bacterium]
MILTCQNCSTSFRLEERLLKYSGSKVRCSRCKHIWRAYPPQADDPETEGRPEIDERPGRGAAAV